MSVLAVADLLKTVESVRATGLKVAFTNGCFDLLHVGHLHTLERARSEADLLVVGVNSDHSVTRLKGPKRPLVHQDDRAELLAGLACVDYVTIFEQDTPVELLEQLRPDVHVKGGDYRPEDLPETPVVERHGGRVVIAPILPGRSTTRLEELLAGVSR